MVGSIFHTVAHSLRSHKLSQDIAISMGSFVVLASSGIVINVAVAMLRDAAALGVFNLAYAVYIVASQIATWGLHYSVLRHSAYHADDSSERTVMLGSAGACTLLFGACGAALLWLSQPLFAIVFKSDATAMAIALSAGGLVLFPFNKVLLAYLNGLRHMRAHAFLQALRYIVVMVGVVGIAASDLPMAASTLAFLLAETVTCVAAIGCIAQAKLSHSPLISMAWCRRHLAFGSKSLPAGMFTEINSRIDVLMIGFFLSDRSVGIYSFAAMLVDGAYHVLAMVRLNFNPVLVAALKQQDVPQLKMLRVQAARYALPVTLLLSFGLIAAYVIASTWIIPGKGLDEGLASLVVLLLGLNLICTWIPFDNLLLVSGRPGYQALQQLVAVGANVIGSSVLLPLLGLEGAALGTALSYISGTAALFVLSRQLIGWRLFTNTWRN